MLIFPAVISFSAANTSSRFFNVPSSLYSATSLLTKKGIVSVLPSAEALCTALTAKAMAFATLFICVIYSSNSSCTS